ncbi:predicted protein [Nematostella vectensis]|uniref:Uncharacterized protein n=1 Tax=Nematostella vectensis TaxID=45351 RepID=A7S4E2_NEMVE|nr:predicted protein [Nematostella vectensis]|eukprot:XP_001633463.1 predicted protein [Nematostella vectensis]
MCIKAPTKRTQHTRQYLAARLAYPQQRGNQQAQQLQHVEEPPREAAPPAVGGVAPAIMDMFMDTQRQLQELKRQGQERQQNMSAEEPEDKKRQRQTRKRQEPPHQQDVEVQEAQLQHVEEPPREAAPPAVGGVAPAIMDMFMDTQRQLQELKRQGQERQQNMSAEEPEDKKRQRQTRKRQEPPHQQDVEVQEAQQNVDDLTRQNRQQDVNIDEQDNNENALLEQKMVREMTKLLKDQEEKRGRRRRQIRQAPRTYFRF